MTRLRAALVTLVTLAATAVVTLGGATPASAVTASPDGLPSNCMELGWYGYWFHDGAVGVCFFIHAFGPNETVYYDAYGNYWNE